MQHFPNYVLEHDCIKTTKHTFLKLFIGSSVEENERNQNQGLVFFENMMFFESLEGRANKLYQPIALNYKGLLYNVSTHISYIGPAEDLRGWECKIFYLCNSAAQQN